MMHEQSRLYRLLQSLLLATTTGLFLTACDQSNANKNAVGPMKQTDIVAGHGEKSFPERYHLKLSLPMPEAAFIGLLKRLKLYYQVCGERGTQNALPSPSQPTTVDLSKAQKCYEIIGDRDPVRRTGEAWRAFTNQNHQIIYIENRFIYTGP